MRGDSAAEGAIHIALGVRADGTKEVVSLWLERRRRWSDEEQVQILADAFATGASVADTC